MKDFMKDMLDIIGAIVGFALVYLVILFIVEPQETQQLIINFINSVIKSISIIRS